MRGLRPDSERGRDCLRAGAVPGPRWRVLGAPAADGSLAQASRRRARAVAAARRLRTRSRARRRPARDADRGAERGNPRPRWRSRRWSRSRGAGPVLGDRRRRDAAIARCRDWRDRRPRAGAGVRASRSAKPGRRGGGGDRGVRRVRGRGRSSAGDARPARAHPRPRGAALPLADDRRAVEPQGLSRVATRHRGRAVRPARRFARSARALRAEPWPGGAGRRRARRSVPEVGLPRDHPFPALPSADRRVRRRDARRRSGQDHAHPRRRAIRGVAHLGQRRRARERALLRSSLTP